MNINATNILSDWSSRRSGLFECSTHLEKAHLCVDIHKLFNNFDEKRADCTWKSFHIAHTWIEASRKRPRRGVLTNVQRRPTFRFSLNTRRRTVSSGHKRTACRKSGYDHDIRTCCRESSSYYKPHLIYSF